VRGGVGRIDKSRAVRQSDGVGMVLANVVSGSVDPDLHAVPTVHVDAEQGETLRRWLVRKPRARVTLTPRGIRPTAPQVAGWSRAGDPRLGVATPGVLAAGRPDSPDARWQLLSGTSVAAAQVSGLAAALRAQRPWSADLVRSALAGAAAPVAGSRSGAGQVSATTGPAALGIEVPPVDYRAWLGGRRTELGTAALLLDRDRRTVTRSVTRTFRARTTGLAGLRVGSPVITLGPGESAEVTVRLVGPLRDGGRGALVWRDATGQAARWPVVVSR
jgi:minor extracellular serine protease Vpr